MSWVVMALLGILAILDVVTTRQAMKNPRLKEANPVIRAMMKHGNLWIVVKVAATGFAMYQLQGYPAVVFGISAIYMFVVWQNAKFVGWV